MGTTEDHRGVVGPQVTLHPNKLRRHALMPGRFDWWDRGDKPVGDAQVGEGDEVVGAYVFADKRVRNGRDCGYRSINETQVGEIHRRTVVRVTHLHEIMHLERLRAGP